MKRTLSRFALLSVAAATAMPAAAIPVGLLDQDGGYVDVTTSLITGVAMYRDNRPDLMQGTPVSIFPPNTMDDKNYTAMVTEFGDPNARHESYVGGPFLFASATANAAGDLEVGIVGDWGASVALSRYSIDIKNNRSRPVDLEFAFTIPEGEVLTIDPSGWPGDAPRAVKTWVGANIDGVLYTPAGPFGGHYEETQLPDMFDFFVLMRGAGEATCHVDDLVPIPGGPEVTCPGKVIDYSANAFPLLQPKDDPNSFVYGFGIDQFDGTLQLPTLEPFAHLTLYYDMFAQVVGHQESFGRAFLGDPVALSVSDGIRIIEHSSPDPPVVSVAEPHSLPLTAFGLIGLALARRGRQQPL